MNTRTLPLLALLLGLSAAGCAADRGSLEAFAICSIPDTCQFTASCDKVINGLVAYDPAGGWLMLPIELRNQVANNGDLFTGRVNTNDAHVTGYRLEFSNGGGSITLTAGNTTVPADGTTVIFVYAAPPTLADGFYTVEISFIGYYDNGREFETPPYPVGFEAVTGFTTVCSGTDVPRCGTDFQYPSVCGAP